MRVGDHLVVTYHYVRPRNSDGVTGITPAEFREHVKGISRTRRVVTAAEFEARRECESGLALITFDDGVRDQYDFAAPILDEVGVPAVFFVPMRPLSDEADGWCAQHLLHALAQHLGFEELERRVDAALRELGPVPRIDVAEMDRLYHYEVRRKRRLKYLLAFALPAQQSSAVLRAVNADVGLGHRDWYMSAEELSRLQAAGHELGGHGFDHLPYTTLSADEQDRDMGRAQKWMSRLFGVRPRPIAFPFGRADATTRALARRHGYTMMFTAEDRMDARDVRRALEFMEAE
ncbi:polysaccharide deacetylase family protein [Leptolyngbya sp. 15MV]|nr:polysaccharide deacetylase family protein [Leptolyngbya sp. 15MV]